MKYLTQIRTRFVLKIVSLAAQRQCQICNSSVFQPFPIEADHSSLFTVSVLVGDVNVSFVPRHRVDQQDAKQANEQIRPSLNIPSWNND